MSVCRRAGGAGGKDGCWSLRSKTDEVFFVISSTRSFLGLKAKRAKQNVERQQDQNRHFEKRAKPKHIICVIWCLCLFFLTPGDWNSE